MVELWHSRTLNLKKQKKNRIKRTKRSFLICNNSYWHSPSSIAEVIEVQMLIRVPFKTNYRVHIGNFHLREFQLYLSVLPLRCIWSSKIQMLPQGSSLCPLISVQLLCPVNQIKILIWRSEFISNSTATAVELKQNLSRKFFISTDLQKTSIYKK